MLNKTQKLDKSVSVLLARIGPAVLLGCMLLDFSFRFIPPVFVCFRAWEAVVLFATALGPFGPDIVYRNPKSYGDLSNMGNLPHLRQYRQEVFRTDSAGFRNRHKADIPFNGILLLGDSFAAGSGVSDEQSLGEVIARISGLSVYNAAPGGIKALDDLQMASGLVLWEQSERAPLPAAIPEMGWKGQLRRLIGRFRILEAYLTSWRSYSPMQIWCGRVIKLIQNDRFFPNHYHDFVESRTLSNGQEMLFLPSEVTNYGDDRQTDPTFFIQLRSRLHAKKIELLVVLVPDKYVVYHDLLSPAADPPNRARRPFMDIIEERLRAAQIPVVNLTGSFRAEAALRLAQNSYLYWLDDTHWNQTGINSAAIKIVDSSLFRRRLPQ